MLTFVALLFFEAEAASQVSAQVKALQNTPGCDEAPAPESGGSIKNPVLPLNFPDPFVLALKDCYFAYATNVQGMNVQVAVSQDLRAWSEPREAMPWLPEWSRQNDPDVWAPEVIEVSGLYLLYFSARHARALVPDPPANEDDRRPCIGIAVGLSPAGPFKPVAEPLICASFGEGAIDPSPFRDADGKLYLYFKRDGNCCLRSPNSMDERLRSVRRPSEIYVQALDKTGMDLVGELAWMGVEDGGADDEGWAGAVVEAPTMVIHDGHYVLFYSGDWFTDHRYAIGFARCEGPLGPCVENDAPILESEPAGGSHWALNGPGHQTLTQKGPEHYILFHSWYPGPQGMCRALNLSRLTWATDPMGAPLPRVHGVPMPGAAAACGR